MPSSSSPSSSPSSLWRSLPTVPGIYIFKNASGQILYIGKAKNLRARVKSYFQPPTHLGPKTAALVQNLTSLEHIQVNSELEALLLESRLIQKFQPPYNIAAKDDKSPYYIHLTSENYPRPLINHQPQLALAGPFLNRLIPSRILRQLRHVAPFCTAPRPVNRPCLYSHLGLCHPCPGTQPSFALYRQNTTRLRRLLRGQFAAVVTDLKKHMITYSKNQQYEKAAAAKKSLTALEYLLHTPVSPDEYIVNPNLVSDTRQAALSALLTQLAPHLPQLTSLNRIEFFDNAHLAGAAPTSAMTVALNGQVTPKNYRHFHIQAAAASDVHMMQEVLTRRLKRSDWPSPQLIVLDGGLAQLSVIHVLTPLSLPPIIALAKRQETLYFPDGHSLQLPPDHPGLQLLMHLRDEAHRFSRRLHHHRRSRTLAT